MKKQLLFLCLSIFALAGCGNSDNPTPTPSPDPGPIQTEFTITMTPNELGEKNNWTSGSASNKTGDMDEYISLTVGGSATGKWSTSNNTWSVTQKSSTDYPNGGFIEISTTGKHHLKSVKIDYSPKSGDSKPGHFEHIVNGVALEMESGCTDYLDYVKADDPEITDSVVRIRSITVDYVLA